jgi:hypothetical protein
MSDDSDIQRIEYRSRLQIAVELWVPALTVICDESVIILAVPPEAPDGAAKYCLS